MFRMPPDAKYHQLNLGAQCFRISWPLSIQNIVGVLCVHRVQFQKKCIFERTNKSMSTALEYAIPEILWHGGGNEGGKPDPVFSVDMHPEGVLATAGVDEMVPPKGTVRLWRNNVDTIIEADKQQHWDNFMCDLSDHPRGSVNVCRFSPNGLMLASASEAQIVIYKVKNATDWKILDEDTKKTKLERIWLRPGLEEIRDLEWSPDSSYIVVASIDNKGEILRVDSKDRGSLGLRGHTNYVSMRFILLKHLLQALTPFIIFSLSAGPRCGLGPSQCHGTNTKC